MNILNYADFPAKLRGRADVQDFIGKYSFFPEYLQSPDLLNNLTWSQYKLLIFFYRLTLGKQRIFGTFTSGDIERNAGIKPQDFNAIIQELKEGSGKKQKEKRLPQLVTEENQSNAKHDPIFHICDLGEFPKQWQVTFLFPLSLRRYGKNKRSEFQPLAKLWYIGDGENHKDEINSGDFIYTVSRRLVFESLRFLGYSDSMETALTDFSRKTPQTHYAAPDDFLFFPEKAEFWVQNAALNQRNHLYMFTIFPHETAGMYGVTLPKLRKITKM